MKRQKKIGWVSGLIECDPVLLLKHSPTFLNNRRVFIFSAKQSGLLDSEDVGIKIFRNVWKYSSNKTKSHQRILQSSVNTAECSCRKEKNS